MNPTLVFGAGRSGVAAANFLAARGVPVIITDSKAESEIPLASELAAPVERVFGGHPDVLLDGIDEIVLSPGIPASVPLLQKATEQGIPIVAEVELGFRHLKGSVTAITGSNGKSTTTALLGEILTADGREVAVAGNIGAPLTAAVDDTERHYVVELSSFQLETIETFRPDVALLLNITPDHMDRYESFDDYAEAKFRIFSNQTPDDRVIFNADDEHVSAASAKSRVWKFSATRPVEPGAWVERNDLVLRTGEGEGRIARSRLKLPGAANVENALAAWLAAHALGVSDAAVIRAFESFAGLPHRMEFVADVSGVRWINDSKGTNVDATVKSLQGMDDGRVLLILGGKDKEGEFERLGPLVRTKVRKVLTIGSAARKIENVLREDTECVPCKDMKGAVRHAREHAREGETILLSPACASFDQYSGFEERGRHFAELVGGVE